jgi:hypothetical protein
MGNIAEYPALSGLSFQAADRRDFVEESRRRLSGHYGVQHDYRLAA